MANSKGANPREPSDDESAAENNLSSIALGHSELNESKRSDDNVNDEEEEESFEAEPGGKSRKRRARRGKTTKASAKRVKISKSPGRRVLRSSLRQKASLKQ